MSAGFTHMLAEAVEGKLCKFGCALDKIAVWSLCCNHCSCMSHLLSHITIISLGFEKLGAHEVFGHLPVPYILCIFGLLLTFFVEKVVFSGSHDHHNVGMYSSINVE